MATATPSPPPTSSHDEEEDDNNHQPPTPLESVRSPPSPIEDVDHHHHHQQFVNSNSPYSPQTSVGKPENPDHREHPPPEDVEDDPEPEPVPASRPPQDKILDREQPSPPPPLSPPSLLQPSPPPTEPEHPSENLSSGHESPISKQSPSPPPRAEDPVESPNYLETPYPNPNPNSNPTSDHESPSPSPSSPTTHQRNPSPKPHDTPKDLSPSSPPPTAVSPSSPPTTAASPSSPPPPQLEAPPLLHAVATSSPTKQQISPWTHQETANLIQAYQEKWYSLKKGPLKANQWEEVAITVAARCGYDEPTKTAKQCRHKIEKLRKRYRTERGKPRSKAAAWNFFKLMDNLEKGPLPISSSQPSMELVEYQKPSNSNGKKRKNKDDGDSEFLVNRRTRSKSSNHHISNGGLARDLRFSDGGHDRVIRGLRTPVVHKHKWFYQEDEEEEEDDDIDEKDEDNEEEEEEGVGLQLAAEIKGFAEKFVKIENKKIEMIKDVERYRLEMENKRMEMILESQQMLIETVNKAFSRSHKPQKLSAN